MADYEIYLPLVQGRCHKSGVMVNKSGLLSVLLVILFALLPAQALEPTRSLLEAQYYTWRQSLMRGDYTLWQKTTATFRQRTVRNLAVSEKKPWPRSLFMMPMRPPALGGLKFIGIKQKGPTVSATYYGKIDFGVEGKPTENAYVLLFVNEKNDWKYDTARFFNLSSLPEVKKRLAKGDKSVLDEHDGFQPLGKIPPAPPLCPRPDYIAKIFVDCPGRRVEARVNNISTHIFQDAREAVIISGGLRKGQNTFIYRMADMPDSPNKNQHLTIGVYIMPETPGFLPAKAYYYHINEGEIPSGMDVVINVDQAMIGAMKPVPANPAPKKATEAPAPSAGR